MKTKKGLSPVITTILLILLSVTAVIIIAGVIIPFVKDSLYGEKECFEASDQLTIDTENGYACNTTDINGNRVDITIKRGQKEVEITGIKISISGGGKTKPYDVMGSSDVTMFDDSDKEIPGTGEALTYSIKTDLIEFESAEVYPVTACGKTCDMTDRAEIESC